MSLATDIKRWLGVKLFPVEPIRCKCGCSDWTVHEHERLNGGFYHHGALGRRGRVCNKCYRVQYNETDQAFYERLPNWLKIDPELKVPAGVDRKVDVKRAFQNRKQIPTVNI